MKLRRGLFAVAAVALVVVTASCGDDDSSDSEGSSPTSETGGTADTVEGAETGDTGSTTLHLAASFEDWQLDPAMFQGGPNVSLLAAVYQKLLAYKPGTSEIVGELAESWEVSPDGLTYTFTLRPDQIFHDGSPVTSDAAKFSYERAISISGTSLAQVESFAAPDPLTLVVTMKEPDRVFLHELASMFGVGYVVNPAIIEANAGSDQGQTYLLTHDAGSGPYELVSFDSAGVVLKAFPDYPGPKPYFTDVDERVLTNIQTQVLQFEEGALDVLTYGIPAQTVDQMANDSRYQVELFGADQQSFVLINPASAPLGTPEARAALAAAIDREAIVTNAYPTVGTLAENFYPFGLLPDGLAPVSTTVDTTAFAAMADSLGPITLGYLSINAQDTLAAETLQIQLAALGADVELQPLDAAAFYDLVVSPDARPDLAILTTDAGLASPDGWARNYFLAGASLNIMGTSVPEGDALIDAARIEIDDNVANDLYAQAAALYMDQVIPIADVSGYAVAQTSIGNIVTDVSNPFGINIQALTGSG